MNLVIDIGNTQIKIAVFDHTSLVYQDIIDAVKIVPVLKNLVEKHAISEVILSHVAKIDVEELDQMKSIFKILVLNHKTKLPFINKYMTPSTLGVDRLALVAGAVNQFPKENVLVIDAGSCITYDFVNTRSEYFGGSISPGIEMRYKSVNSFTANLPLLDKIVELPEIGNSTDNAIHRGILNGVIQEIDGVIQQYKDINRKLTVVLTGGDTIFLAKNLKSGIFAIPNFLLEGLNSILIHNIEE
jgi:type III pantothenate kinase